MPKPPPAKKNPVLETKVEAAIKSVPNLLNERNGRFLNVEPGKHKVKTQFVTEDAYAWVDNGRRVAQHLGKEMLLRGTRDDDRYKALLNYFERTPGMYPLGNVSFQGMTRTREMPTLCDALYPDFTPGIVNPFLVDLLTKKTRRDADLLGVLYAESKDTEGYFTKPPVLCIHIK